MTVWVLHKARTPEEEAAVTQSEKLQLPIKGIPDLSQVASAAQLRQALLALHPDAAPETLTSMADRPWHMLESLEPEDIIAVPLPHRQEVALADIVGRYGYEVDENGEDVHTIEVRWYDKRPSFKSFAKHKALLKGRDGLHEVTDVAERTAIRNHLPHSYNRFMLLKKFVIVIFILEAIVFAARGF